MGAISLFIAVPPICLIMDAVFYIIFSHTIVNWNPLKLAAAIVWSASTSWWSIPVLIDCCFE